MTSEVLKGHNTQCGNLTSHKELALTSRLLIRNIWHTILLAALGDLVSLFLKNCDVSLQFLFGDMKGKQNKKRELDIC